MTTKLESALVLTAGLGTRLRPLSDVRAKPAMPVAGQPLIRRIVRWLVSQGVTDLVLNLHHRPETLTAVAGDGSDLGARIRYSWEQPRVLGSAGGPKLALPLVGRDPFLIVNGDTLTDVDIPALAADHESSGALVTLALVPNREHDRYGGVLLDDEGTVTGWVRRGPRAAGSWHFIGVQVARAAALRGVEAGAVASSIGGAYDELMRSSPGSVHGFRCGAEFWDIGTAADYWRTAQAFMRREGQGDVDAGRRVHIEASARVRRSVLWDDVDVGADATIEDSIVTDGVRVPAGATYRQAIVMSGDEGSEPTACPLEINT